MKDYYTEILLEKVPNATDKTLCIIFAVLAVLGIVIMPIMPLGIIGTVVFGLLAKFMQGRAHMEYEYLFVNGDMDIDKIINKRKRKHLLTCRLGDVEFLAPEGHDTLREFSRLKKVDYSSGRAGAKRYVLVVRQGGETEQVIFEPDATIIEGFEMQIPRKVVRK